MSCPNWLKEAYRKAVGYKCQRCKKHEDKIGTLQVHRLIRGNRGGTYEPNNCKIVCKKCHKLFHQMEFK